MSVDNQPKTPSIAGDWHRIFEPLHVEHDYMIDEIDGRLPAELVGTAYRIGPGKWEQGGAPLAHLLEGDGMVSSYTFDGTTVRYRNRYVRTPGYAAGLTTSGITQRTVGTLIPGGPAANAGQPVVQQANTHVVRHARKLLALYGGAKPWALDPTTLETSGLWDVGGMLDDQRPGFSAHAKLDPRTGEFFNFANTPGPEPKLHMYRIDANGNGARLASAEVPFADWVHDFALSDANYVFALPPFKFDIARMISGEASPCEALQLHQGLGSAFVLIPRDGSDARVIEHDAIAYFHVTNAYEDGNEVVLELAQFAEPWEDINRSMFEYRTGSMDYFANELWQYRISKHGKVRAEQLSDYSVEWPQLDWRCVGKKHRYSYHSTVDPQTGAGGLLKIDHESGASTHHQLAAGNVAGECSFVARNPNAAEDDGWILFVAYDPLTHRSRMVILDARDIAREAVAVAHLRHHAPLGFHGSFASAI